MKIFKIIKKTTTFVFVLCLIFSFNLFVVRAAPLPAFGGLDVAAVPCTCTPGLFSHFFVPLYLNTSVPVAGNLNSYANVVAFSYYYLHPGSWALGTLLPPIPCLIGFPPFCFPLPLPQYGTIAPMTGVSPTI